ncbi:hypothetical protein B0H21DRAFT_822305 [Amylocystis lapponica]|nr:hypothetical protein B0H21DRAFT_822305 [Amylocystis lapponica]
MSAASRARRLWAAAWSAVGGVDGPRARIAERALCTPSAATWNEMHREDLDSAAQNPNAGCIPTPPSQGKPPSALPDRTDTKLLRWQTLFWAGMQRYSRG